MMASWPDFFITGPGRSGTTSLANYLDQHPEIHFSPQKEPRFFDATWEAAKDDPTALQRAKDEYHALFEDANPGQVLGEGSVSYVKSRAALERIRDHVPDPRIIVSYRDPIQRAYSLYWLNVAAGREFRDFTEAVQAEIGGERESDETRRYVRNGRQGSQLQRLQDVFGEDRVLVLLFEDLKSSPTELLREVASFLDVDPEPMEEVVSDRTHNAGPGVPLNGKVQAFRSSEVVKRIARILLPKQMRDFVANDLLLEERERPPMDDEARRLLQMYFEPEVAHVEKLLDRELPELRASWDKNLKPSPDLNPSPSARRIQGVHAEPPPAV